jgi:hypothetical protein
MLDYERLSNKLRLFCRDYPAKLFLVTIIDFNSCGAIAKACITKRYRVPATDIN